jgi:hypothetical protein
MSDPLQILSFNVVSVYQKLHSGRSNGSEALFDSQRRLRLRRVSTTLRQVLTEFSEFCHVSGTGLLIQTSLGRAGGFGALRTKRSG